MQKKSEISELKLKLSRKQQLQRIEEEDLTALRSSLSSVCSYQMMAGILAAEADESDVGRSVTVELARVLRAEILGVNPEAATDIELVQPYDSVGDPLCQKLGEQDGALKPQHAVIHIDVRLNTITTHRIAEVEEDEGGAYEKKVLGSVVLRFQRSPRMGSAADLEDLPPWALHSIVDAKEIEGFGWQQAGRGGCGAPG